MIAKSQKFAYESVSFQRFPKTNPSSPSGLLAFTLRSQSDPPTLETFLKIVNPHPQDDMNKTDNREVNFAVFLVLKKMIEKNTS